MSAPAPLKSKAKATKKAAEPTVAEPTVAEPTAAVAVAVTEEPATVAVAVTEELSGGAKVGTKRGRKAASSETEAATDAAPATKAKRTRATEAATETNLNAESKAAAESTETVAESKAAAESNAAAESKAAAEPKATTKKSKAKAAATTESVAATEPQAAAENKAATENKAKVTKKKATKAKEEAAVAAPPAEVEVAVGEEKPKAKLEFAVPVATAQRVLKLTNMNVTHTDPKNAESKGADERLAEVITNLMHELVSDAMALKNGEKNGEKARLKTVHLQKAISNSDKYGPLAAITLKGAASVGKVEAPAPLAKKAKATRAKKANKGDNTNVVANAGAGIEFEEAAPVTVA